MRKLASVSLLLGVIGFVSSGVYPLENGIVSTPSSPVLVGATFEVGVTCAAGETATFSFADQVVTDTCTAVNTSGVAGTPSPGSATASLVAPDTAGTYGGSVALDESAITVEFSISVVAAAGETPDVGEIDELAFTGSTSRTPLILGLSLVFVGLLLAGLGYGRKRRLLL